ncbi:MAG TPA: Ig-like domain-containing protein [Longimicrobium sp.]|nr:Ig-like domain-containing protein [Longimicrobium sp.]
MKTHHRILVTALAALAACDGAGTPTGAGDPRLSISDGAHGGNPGFHWLPPMVSNPGATGTFDAALSPVVEICALGGTSCASTIATYTTTSGPAGEHVVVKGSESHYLVNWHTRDFDLDSATTYRIRVSVGALELGHADVRIVANGSAAKNVNTAEYIPLVDGRTLPVKFRIDTGIPAAITVTPATATVEPGGTQQYTAVVTDLHGAVIAAPITWSSGATGIATVGASGLATGVAEGTAAITATSGTLSGSAELVVDQGIHRWHLMNAPADQGNWAVWGTSATDVYAANWLGVVHYDGTQWSKVDTVWWHGALDIYGTSGSNLYTVGPGGRIMHYDGQVWSQERYDGGTVFAQPLNDWTNILPNIYLWGVWAAAPDDWFVVGDGGTILRGEQGSWQVMSSGTTENLRRVWGSSATDVYAVGENGTVLHFDGTAWSAVSVPVSVNLFGVWGTGPGDVWVTGDAGKLLHFDGGAWTATQMPTAYNLYGVWGTSASNVYVGGQGGVIYRWNGTSWIFEDSTTNAQIYDFWGPDGTDVFAATAAWELLRR